MGNGKSFLGLNLVYMIQKELAMAKESKRETVVQREFLEKFKYANYLCLNCKFLRTNGRNETISFLHILEGLKKIALKKIHSLYDVPEKEELAKEMDPCSFFTFLSEKRPLIIHIDEFQGIFRCNINNPTGDILKAFIEALSALDDENTLIYVSGVVPTLTKVNLSEGASNEKNTTQWNSFDEN